MMHVYEFVILHRHEKLSLNVEGCSKPGNKREHALSTNNDLSKKIKCSVQGRRVSWYNCAMCIEEDDCVMKYEAM